ncbi:MAG: hypothetical protein DDT18_01722 [Actinobacteria bacterium]|nr:hypothetical protein [Actinomycetota bacterium]
MAPLGGVQSSLDAGYPAPNNQDVLVHLEEGREKLLVPAYLEDSFPDQINSLPCSCLLVGMDPGALLPNIGHLHQIGIEPSLPGSPAEGLFMHFGRAGRYYHPVQTVLLDSRFDQILSALGAQVGVISGIDHMGKALCCLHHPGTVYRARNIATTVTDKDTYSHKKLPAFSQKNLVW